MISSNVDSALKPSARARLASELARPARNNLLNERIWLTTDALDNLLAGDLAQRLDLPTDRDGKSRHRKIATRADFLAIERGCMNKEIDCRTRRGVPVHDIVRHRQHGLVPSQRLADDVGEETGRGLVRLAGSHTDGGKPDADAVEKALAGVIRQEQLANGFLRAVRGQRRGEEVVRNLLGKWCSDTRRSSW